MSSASQQTGSGAGCRMQHFKKSDCLLQHGSPTLPVVAHRACHQHLCSLQRLLVGSSLYLQQKRALSTAPSLWPADPPLQ